MKINDRVKTIPLYAKKVGEEFAGVITEINTQPKKIHHGSGIAFEDCGMATFELASIICWHLNENRPNETYTVATVKTDSGDTRYTNTSWLEKNSIK